MVSIDKSSLKEIEYDSLETSFSFTKVSLFRIIHFQQFTKETTFILCKQKKNSPELVSFGTVLNFVFVQREKTMQIFLDFAFF